MNSNAMIKLIKATLLFLAFNFTISCNLWPKHCYGIERESFSGKIKLEEYYSDGRVYHKGWNVISTDSLLYTEKFAFYENDSFSYLKIAHQNSENDTIEKLNGKFKINKDRKYSWHILKLSSDSIYEKQMTIDTLNGSLYFSSNFTATKFLGFPDSLLTDVGNWVDSAWNVDSTCFNLSVKGWNDSNDCNDGYYSSLNRTFCLRQPDETPEQISTGDSL
jgi:hypothetical protein